jgi:hypothetical protein
LKGILTFLVTDNPKQPVFHCMNYNVMQPLINMPTSQEWYDIVEQKFINGKKIKDQDKVIPRQQRINEIMAELRSANTKAPENYRTKTDNSTDAQWKFGCKTNYSLIVQNTPFGPQELLFRKVGDKLTHRVISLEESYSRICQAHQDNHVGRDATFKWFKDNHVGGIKKTMVDAFIKMCPHGKCRKHQQIGATKDTTKASTKRRKHEQNEFEDPDPASKRTRLNTLSSVPTLENTFNNVKEAGVAPEQYYDHTLNQEVQYPGNYYSNPLHPVDPQFQQLQQPVGHLDNSPTKNHFKPGKFSAPYDNFTYSPRNGPNVADSAIAAGQFLNPTYPNDAYFFSTIDPVPIQKSSVMNPYSSPYATQSDDLNTNAAYTTQPESLESNLLNDEKQLLTPAGTPGTDSDDFHFSRGVDLFISAKTPSPNTNGFLTPANSHSDYSKDNEVISSIGTPALDINNLVPSATGRSEPPRDCNTFMPISSDEIDNLVSNVIPAFGINKLSTSTVSHSDASRDDNLFMSKSQKEFNCNEISSSAVNTTLPEIPATDPITFTTNASPSEPVDPQYDQEAPGNDSFDWAMELIDNWELYEEYSPQPAFCQGMYPLHTDMLTIGRQIND